MAKIILAMLAAAAATVPPCASTMVPANPQLLGTAQAREVACVVPSFVLLHAYAQQRLPADATRLRCFTTTMYTSAGRFAVLQCSMSDGLYRMMGSCGPLELSASGQSYSTRRSLPR
jgi:hypothetical protein